MEPPPGGLFYLILSFHYFSHFSRALASCMYEYAAGMRGINHIARLVVCVRSVNTGRYVYFVSGNDTSPQASLCTLYSVTVPLHLDACATTPSFKRATKAKPLWVIYRPVEKAAGTGFHSSRFCFITRYRYEYRLSPALWSPSHRRLEGLPSSYSCCLSCFSESEASLDNLQAPRHFWPVLLFLPEGSIYTAIVPSIASCCIHRDLD